MRQDHYVVVVETSMLNEARNIVMTAIKTGDLVQVLKEHGWWSKLKDIQNWDPKNLLLDIPRHNVERKFGLVVVPSKDIGILKSDVPDYYIGFVCILIDETIWMIKPKYVKKVSK